MKKVNLKYVLFPVIILFLCLILFIFVDKNLKQKHGKNSEHLNKKIERVNKYAAEIIQIGGAGSRIVQITTWDRESQEYFPQNENWTSYGLNSPADILWFACREEYELISCEAYGDKKEIDKESSSCGVTMKNDVPQNRVYIECSKRLRK